MAAVADGEVEKAVLRVKEHAATLVVGVAAGLIDEHQLRGGVGGGGPVGDGEPGQPVAVGVTEEGLLGSPRGPVGVVVPDVEIAPVGRAGPAEVGMEDEVEQPAVLPAERVRAQVEDGLLVAGVLAVLDRDDAPLPLADEPAARAGPGQHHSEHGILETEVGKGVADGEGPVGLGKRHEGGRSLGPSDRQRAARAAGHGQIQDDEGGQTDPPAAGEAHDRAAHYSALPVSAKRTRRATCSPMTLSTGGASAARLWEGSPLMR